MNDFNNCGVYEITLSKSKGFYIGASANLSTRWELHGYTLKAGRHSNLFLQAAFNEDQTQEIRFRVLIKCPPERLSFFEDILTFERPRDKYNFSYLSFHFRSELTKAALAAAKARGVKLGGPRPPKLTPWARTLGIAARKAKADATAADLAPTIAAIRAAGATSLRAIAAALNANEIPTPSGNRVWHAQQVSRVLTRQGLCNGCPHAP